MTIAISLKVNDGLVLAADSASTLIGRNPDGTSSVVNVYNNANKIFNLYKGLPVGAITWGSGSIGNASISTLAKDFRRRLSGQDEQHHEWKIDPYSYNVMDIANRLKAFMFDELYLPEFKEWTEKPGLGFIVAGYSAGNGMAEEYQFDIVNGECIGPRLVRPKSESGVTWSGEPEAISRILLGYSNLLPQLILDSQELSQQSRESIKGILDNLSAPVVVPAMPIQDAIDLAEFLVDLSIKFSRFTPGAQTVGGPIEIAAITKHEGFKWVLRKHYFTRELNPEEVNANAIRNREFEQSVD
jgi:hypothetical protein